MRFDEGADVTTEQVLKSHEVPWESFTSLRLISDRDAQLIKKYDKRKRDTQAELLEQVSIVRLALTSSMGPSSMGSSCRYLPPADRYHESCRHLLTLSGFCAEWPCLL